MKKSTLFDKVNVFKEKIFSFFQHRKKVAALTNYAACSDFSHRPYLLLLKNCLSQAFLDKEEAGFLEHLLGKYDIAYLDWAHKTRWLKAQMAQRAQNASKRAEMAQISFNFEKAINTPVKVPIEILATRSVSRPIRRI